LKLPFGVSEETQKQGFIWKKSKSTQLIWWPFFDWPCSNVAGT